MSLEHPPAVNKVKITKKNPPFVKITFKPNYSHFGYKQDIPQIIENLAYTRTCLAATYLEFLSKINKAKTIIKP